MTAITKIGPNCVEKINKHTGTKILKVFDDDGNIITKAIIPSPLNRVSTHSNYLISNFANGKAQTLIINRIKPDGISKQMIGVFNRYFDDNWGLTYVAANKNIQTISDKTVNAIQKTIKTTGTKIIKLFSEGELISKTVIPETKNKKYLTSSFANGKAQTLVNNKSNESTNPFVSVLSRNFDNSEWEPAYVASETSSKIAI